MSSRHSTVKLERKHLTPTEMERLVHGASEGVNRTRDRAMCLLLFEHALRVTELCRLTMDHVFMGPGEPRAYIHSPRLKHSLSKPQDMKAHTQTALQKWVDIRPQVGYRNVFLSRLGRPFTRQGINHLVDAWADRAAIPFIVTPHMLRHSCGHTLINHPTGTRNLRQIQEWMGHKDIKNTERYTALQDDRFKGLWGDDA
jgi:type 1 fimbriae regulatory protein FimB